MQNHAEVIVVQLIDYLSRIGKYVRVPRKGAVLCVPTGWAKACTEINQSIAGQFLFTECLGFGEHFIATRESSMRLLISQTPERWQLGVACETCILGHDGGRIGRHDNENVQRKWIFRIRRGELGLRACEVERPERLVKENCPTGRTDDPGNRDSRAVGLEFITALPILHVVDGASSIKLRTSFPET